MSIRHVLAAAASLQRDRAGLAFAEALGAHFSAHVTALIVAVHAGSHFAEEQAPLSAVLADFAKGARSKAALEREEIVAWLGAHAPHFALRDVAAEAALGEREALAHARCADLTVLTRGDDPLHRSMLTTLLFQSGRPVVLAPADWAPRGVCERILIGWNAKREAVRAVNDAMPLLRAARQVVVATVDATPSPAGHGEAPGCELAAHLARHGIKAEVSNIDGLGRPHGRALLESAVAIDADLIVIGGYGHTRAAELVFGGVTNDLAAACPIPLLLSH